jgi:membrane protease YdiL (CAAX protease family)
VRRSLQPRPSARHRRRGSSLGVVALVAVFVGAIAWTWWRTGGDVVPSRDEGAPAVPLLGTVAAAVITLGVARLLPPRLPTPVPRSADPSGVVTEVAFLLLCAAAFALTALVPGPPEDYVLWKVVLLVLVPAGYLAWRRRRRGPSVEILRPQHRLPVWLWALLPAALYVVLTQFGPLAPAAPTGWPDPVTLVVAATVTALTAGVGEELFYRYWMQSRLEALAGRWIGILVTSLVFGLVHLGSHGAGLGVDLGVTTVIASQGVFGVVVGYLWSRYRRFWVCVLLHVAVNGTLVVLHLLGLA